MEERAVTGVAAMSLLESLLTELERKGVLSEEEIERIYQDALAKAQASQSGETAEFLRIMGRANPS